MRPHADAGMSLYGPTAARKYLNAAERRRFIRAAQRAPATVGLFCLVLGWSGGRISEVLALTPAAIRHRQQRRDHRNIEATQARHPRDTLRELNHFFKLRRLQRDPELAIERTTAWRRVKEVMEPGLAGRPPCRGGYAIHSA
jgi:hypothetical protein